MNVCIFNIGTWHTHVEDNNVLVKLWKDCKLHDLGFIENQNGKKTGNEVLAKTANWSPIHCKWINDGADAWGNEVRDQTESNMKVLHHIATKAKIDNVVLVGHSRGAILAVRIAARLCEEFKTPTQCHLFLYDPVKRMMDGTDWYNREIHNNVTTIRVIVMEDQMEIGFKLLTIKVNKGPGPRKDIGESDYTRLPGTHGTATQVTGHPIGTVGYILAAKFLKAQKIKLAPGVGITDDDLLKQYCRIPIENPVRKRMGIRWRIVNDFEKGKQGEKTKLVGGDRTAKLDQKAGKNPFSGSEVFVNEEHHGLFSKKYPSLALLFDGLPGPRNDPKKVAADLRMLSGNDRDTYMHIMKLLNISWPSQYGQG
jgi:hypothetical protein